MELLETVEKNMKISYQKDMIENMIKEDILFIEK